MVSCKAENKTNKNEEIIKTNSVMTQSTIPYDTYQTNAGELKILLLGHASLMFEFNGRIIHIDPYSMVADYSKYPKADLIMLTHGHRDHLDMAAIEQIRKNDTRFIVAKVCNEILGYGDILNNGDNSSYEEITIEAVPAYNIVGKTAEGNFFHPKGQGNGYVLTFGDKKVYVAGDTENIPEMDKLKGNIYIAFLPKNLPYTMSDDMFIDAAKKVTPQYLYPYHLSEFDSEKIGSALKDSQITILERPMSSK